MKIVKQVGNKTTYSEFINGRECRATTTRGVPGATEIFDIYRKTNGVGRSAPMPL
jgi:hypothetical protein